MAKKLRPKNKPLKAKDKKPVGRIPSLSNSRSLPKKIKKPAKKKAVIRPKLLPVKKKPALKKTAAIKKSHKKPKILSVKKNKGALKPITRKPDATFVDAEKLPAHYDSTDVTLMVRDPYWIHAYWETAPSSVLEVKKKMGADAFKKSVYTLRIHDVGAAQSKVESAQAHFDIDVDPKAQNWYINLWRDNVTYYADFGVRAPQGAFYPLARSNTVTLPRAATAPDMPDAIWMRVKEIGECSIVNVRGTKPLAAVLRPLPGGGLALLPLDRKSAGSDSGFSRDINGFFGSNQLERTSASGGSGAYPW